MLGDEPDLHCLLCDYNLKTLSDEGLCPECGTPVRQSIDASQMSGLGNVYSLAKARRLLSTLAILLGLASFVLAADPFWKGSISTNQSIPSHFAWIGHLWGDRLAICAVLITACFPLRRLVALVVTKNSAAGERRVFQFTASVGTPITVAILTLINIGDCVVWSIGYGTLRTHLGQSGTNALSQIIWWGLLILQPLAFACVASPAIFLENRVVSHKPKTSFRLSYLVIRSTIGLLILCALLSAATAASGIIAGWVSAMTFFSKCLQNGCESVIAICVGLSAILLGFYSRSLQPDERFEPISRITDQRAVLASMKFIANATFSQMALGPVSKLI